MKNHISQLSRLNKIIKYFDNVFVSLPEFGISSLSFLHNKVDQRLNVLLTKKKKKKFQI